MNMSKSVGVLLFFGTRYPIESNGTDHFVSARKLARVLMLGLVLASALSVPLSAQALNSYYVRAGATGSNNGSDWSNAYAALPTTLLRDSVYYIADGTYGGRTFSTPTSGTSLITIKKATASDHGTTTGWNGAYGDGQAVFNGMFDFTSSNWVVDGQTGGGHGSWNTGFGFKIVEKGAANAIIRIAYSGTADNITIRHVELQGQGSAPTQGGSYSNDGLAVYGASNVTLSYYWMYGIGRCPFFISPQNLIVEHGWVESYYSAFDVHSAVASIWGFDGSVGDTTFRFNLFTDMQSTGGLMWDNISNANAHLYIYGNIFYRIPGSRWTNSANGLIGGWTNGVRTSNILVYNNTFINIDYMIYTTFAGSASGNAAFNNLYYNSVSPDYAKFSTHDYNYYISSGGSQSETHGTSASSGDPFVDYPNFNFALKAANAPGTSLLSPYNLDPVAKTRGADGTWDRGALEFLNGGTTAIAPPTNLRIK
jgi:hypothetical protein